MSDAFHLRQELLSRIRESGEVILQSNAIESHFPNGNAQIQARNFAFDNDLIISEIDSGIQFEEH
jgi:hypothetical protein